MSLDIVDTNIFTSSAQTLVNTVNCEGVMGAGIALEFRLRYTTMYDRYQQLCAEGLMQPGKLWLYKGAEPWVLNFPTKQQWKQPSRWAFITLGLENLAQTFAKRGITSLALPLLGADKGGLDPEEVLTTMNKLLAPVAEQIPVTIHRYRADQPDDLYQAFANRVLASEPSQLAKESGITPKRVGALVEAVRSGQFCQLNQLARVPGIGEKTLERLFHHCRQAKSSPQPLSLL